MGVGRCEDAARRNLGRHLAFDPGGVVGRDVQSLRDVVALRRSWGVGSTRGQSACDRCRRPGQLRFDGPRRCDDVTGADHDLDGGPGPILDDRDRADHLRHHDGDFAVDEQCGPVDVHAARSGDPSGSPPLNIAWSRTTVAAGPYNGLVRSDGFGLTSVNSSTPGVVWISDDGVAWTARELPDGFAAIDSSRSRDLVALIGTRSSSTGKVPALAHSVDGSEWTVDVLDVGDLGPATRPDSRSQIAVSGQRIVAAVDAGPPAGSSTRSSAWGRSTSGG